jgi:hypothetical protein
MTSKRRPANARCPVCILKKYAHYICGRCAEWHLELMLLEPPRRNPTDPFFTEPWHYLTGKCYRAPKEQQSDSTPGL